MSFRGTRNHTRKSTKIDDLLCGVTCEDFSSLEMTRLWNLDSSDSEQAKQFKNWNLGFKKIGILFKNYFSKA